MLYFEKKRTRDTVCMESILFETLRIQTVFDSGFYLRHKPVDPNLHRHLNHELYFVEAGESTVLLREKEITCHAGEVLLITAGSEHCVKKMSEGARLLSMRCSFYPEREGSALYAELSAALRAPVLLTEADKIFDLIEPLKRELLLQKRFADEALRGLLKVFYTELLRALFGVFAKKEEKDLSFDPAVFRVLKSFREDTPEEFYKEILDEFFTHLPKGSCTLTELSARLCLSVSQAQRLIKKYYGVSFREKLLQAKILKSIRLMAQTDASLEQIASEVGYDSYNAFFEAFVATTGKKPSEYRKQAVKG